MSINASHLFMIVDSKNIQNNLVELSVQGCEELALGVLFSEPL